METGKPFGTGMPSAAASRVLHRGVGISEAAGVYQIGELTARSRSFIVTWGSFRVLYGVCSRAANSRLSSSETAGSSSTAS
jgi:hypothetical protein